MAMQLIELVSFDFAPGRLLDRLEDFDMKVSEYERESKEELSDTMRIGIVIKGMEKGSLREHLLLWRPPKEQKGTSLYNLYFLQHTPHGAVKINDRSMRFYGALWRFRELAP